MTKQRQDSLQDQLRDLYYLAVDAGMYDAAQWLQDTMLDRTRHKR